MNLKALIPTAWQTALEPENSKPYFKQLETFLETEYATQTVFPPQELVFRALELTPLESVKVVILGQDPYHDNGQAHGLAFSVQPGIKVPPSLLNMYKELETDLGIPRTKTGFLEPWAKQGILMLNAVLTVRAHTAASHQKRGWETFTDVVIQTINAKTTPVIFVLWGAYAHKKAALITSSQHTILKAVHPSPLSANNGFFGSKPFSSINAILEKNGQDKIDWHL